MSGQRTRRLSRHAPSLNRAPASFGACRSSQLALVRAAAGSWKDASASNCLWGGRLSCLPGLAVQAFAISLSLRMWSVPTLPRKEGRELGSRASCKEDEPLPPVNWRYGSALLSGALGGALAFLLQQYLRPSVLEEQFAMLMLFLCAGALLGCVVVALRNRAAWRAWVRLERQRGFEVARHTRHD